MTYFGPVSQAAVDKAQARFWRLIALSFLSFGGLGAWWWLDPRFWSGHRLWVSGAALILLSVVHAKYFDIRRVSNPGNRQYDPANASRLSRIVEGLVKAAWIAGFILVGVSRLTPQ